MKRITLAWHEVAMAVAVGEQRHLEALREKREVTRGCEAPWQAHIEGACGELALAKAFGLYWDGSVNTFQRGGDVGAIQVRTRSRPFYELLLYREDRDDDAFVLVRGQAPQYDVVGWLYAREGKKPPYWKSHRKDVWAYFAPDAILRSLDTLPLDLGRVAR